MESYMNKEQMYKKIIVEGLSYSKTAKELGCSTTAVRNWAIKFGFTRKKEIDLIDEGKKERIITAYMNTAKFIKEIATEENVTVWMARRVLQDGGIELKSRKEIKKELDERGLCRVLDVQHNYFKNWSNDMAYIMGFIWADGCLVGNKNELKINLQVGDIDLLYDIKNKLNFEGRVYKRDVKLKNKIHHYSSLSINSLIMLNDLRNLGLTERKSYTIEWPTELPEEYRIDFIRGYFDGNGSVGSQYPTNSRGTRTKSIQIRVRICSGSEKMIEKIRDVLHEYGLKKVTITNQLPRGVVYEISYSTFDSLKFYNMVYKNEDQLFLHRKKVRFEEIIDIRNKQ